MHRISRDLGRRPGPPRRPAGDGRGRTRRLGSGSTLVLADYSAEALAAATQDLRHEGYRVITQQVDVSDTASVAALARAAADTGPVTTVVHTAGLSPVQAAPGAILAVDLLGTATMLDAFAEVIAAGGSGVFIASMAGHLATLPAEVEQALSATPTADLLALPFLSPQAITTSAAAYGVAKRANQLRVAAAAHGWGQRGARVATTDAGRSLTWHLGVLLATGPTRRGDRCRPTAGPAPAAG